MSVIFLNGRFVNTARAKISVFDRGFLYGDGVFETLRLSDGNPLHWEAHLARFLEGAAYLKIRVPRAFREPVVGCPPVKVPGTEPAETGIPNHLSRFMVPRRAPERAAAAQSLHAIALELARRNHTREAVLRMQLTRGPGPRGYAISRARHPTLVMSLHPAPRLNPRQPPHCRLITATTRLPLGDPLSRFKTCNRLPYILARAEAEAAGADDALLLNARGEVVETSSANVFWTDGRTLFTPPLSTGALPGITRAAVLERARQLDIGVREQRAARAALSRARGMFLTASIYGIAMVAQLDARRLRQVDWVCRLREATTPHSGARVF